MDPPPPSATTSQLLNHPDSDNSSPRSRQDTTWDDHNHQPLASIPGGSAKLRLMCSYGGHIIPRPHDKSLCYVGGETRIVVVDRQSSLAELHSRLSQTLLNGRHFTLKYQLPTEELDSLISMATEEDMENMIEEYDRSSCGASPLKPSRLRLFLFPSRPETAASMGSLLDDAKSETWFVDALNGSGFLPRGHSDSAAIDNNLLELEHSIIMNNVDSSPNLDPDPIDQSNKQGVMESSPVGITVEMNSSFGSSSSSPSTANLPPIKVRVENQQIVGLDEQLSQMNLQNAAAAVTAAAAPPVNDVNKSDTGAAPPSALRKPPLPLQPVQRKFVDIHNLPSPDSKRAGVTNNLPSPDSVASDSSIASGGSSLSKHSMYQDGTQIPNPENRVPTPVDQKMTNNNNITQDPNSQIPIQQQMTDHHLQISPQQQFIHQNTNNTHYIPSYYPMYLPQQPQQQSFQHQQTDPNTHYAMYLLPPQSHTQTGYDTSSARPVQQIYQTKPEMAQNMYSTVTGPTTPTPAPMLYHQVPAHQFQQQQQYMALSQIPSQPQTGNVNYGYEYSQANQDQMHYAQAQQHQAIPPPQYQTITPAAAAAMMSQASPPQLPMDNNSAQQL